MVCIMGKNFAYLWIIKLERDYFKAMELVMEKMGGEGFMT